MKLGYKGFLFMLRYHNLPRHVILINLLIFVNNFLLVLVTIMFLVIHRDTFRFELLDGGIILDKPHTICL